MHRLQLTESFQNTLKIKKQRDIVLCHGNQRVRRTCKHTEGSVSGSISLDIVCLQCRNLGFVKRGSKNQTCYKYKGLWQKQEIGTLI